VTIHVMYLDVVAQRHVYVGSWLEIVRSDHACRSRQRSFFRSFFGSRPQIGIPTEQWRSTCRFRASQISSDLASSGRPLFSFFGRRRSSPSCDSLRTGSERASTSSSFARCKEASRSCPLTRSLLSCKRSSLTCSKPSSDRLRRPLVHPMDMPAPAPTRRKLPKLVSPYGPALGRLLRCADVEMKP
jgi:hypothetical protein